MVSHNYCGETEENGPLVGQIGIEGVHVRGWDGKEGKDEHDYSKSNPNVEGTEDQAGTFDIDELNDEVDERATNHTPSVRSNNFKISPTHAAAKPPSPSSPFLASTSLPNKKINKKTAVSITCLAYIHIYQHMVLLLSTDRGFLIKVNSNL